MKYEWLRHAPSCPMRLDDTTNQLQLSNRLRPIKGEMQTIYPNRISFKELLDMLHDESSKFKAQKAAGSRQLAVGSKNKRQ
jgi:hypothetical protein